MAKPDALATAASIISLIAYLSRLVEQRNAGEITPEQLKAAWAALSVRRGVTKKLWEDVKTAGGYE